MAVLTLGNSLLSEDVGNINPILIPVESLPVKNLLLLNNPLLIGAGINSDSLWVRNTTNNSLHPLTITDKVVVGGTSFLTSEVFNVHGDASISGLLYLGTTTNYITLTDGELSFYSSIVTGGKKLSELLSSPLAVDILVADAHPWYNTPKNVENILQQIGLSLSNKWGTPGNSTLLLSLTGFTNDQLIGTNGAITLAHVPVTTDISSPLFLISGQNISITQASSSNDGYLTQTDWIKFNNSTTLTDTLNAIKDLTLVDLGLMVGGGPTSASILAPDGVDKYLHIKSDGSALEWSAINVQSQFQVPGTYTSISNPIGDIKNSVEFTPVTNLNSLTILQVLQKMLFPVPAYPTFTIPTLSISSTLAGTYIETGSTNTVTLGTTFNAGLPGPGGNVNSIVDGSVVYTKNSVAYTNPTTVVFTANQTYTATQAYKYNPAETTTLANGTPINAGDYTGYPTGTKEVTASRTYTIVDPIYYGCITAGASTYPTTPIDSELILATKIVIPEPTSLSLSVTSYSGSVNTSKYIVIYYPDSYGTLSQILYVQGGNANIIGSFTNTTVTHTRPNATTVTYRVYYALNAYNSSETVTYTIVF